MKSCIAPLLRGITDIDGWKDLNMSDTPADVIGFYSTQLGVDEAAAESVLASALGRGGSFAELYFEHKRSGSLSFEDQQVKSTQASLSQGVGIRVVEGDAIGYAYTEDLSLEAMRRAAATAAQIAHGTVRDRSSRCHCRVLSR